MKLTKDQQIVMLHDAARASSMDGHIVSEPPPSTMAERVMTWFGGRKNTPRKNSYLYLDSVDACFFYSNFGTPMQLQVVNLASSDYVEMGEQLMSAQDAGASTSASSTNQTKATGAEGLKSTVGETISSSAYSAYVKSYQNKPASSSGPNARNAAAFSAA